jgi:hypothetical protein
MGCAIKLSKLKNKEGKSNGKETFNLRNAPY